MTALVAAYKTTVGKKVVVAITGLLLFLFVMIHMIGNLQLYAGPEKLNKYAEFLKSALPLLWTFRIVMFAAVLLHLSTTFLLFCKNANARPVPYKRKKNIEADAFARTMIWSGPIIAAFVVYHLLHFTVGSAHPAFDATDVYRNVVLGFSEPVVAGVYILANAMLAFHLKHGLWSWFQTLGLAHPAYNPWRKHFATGLAGLVLLGNVSMPVAVLAGYVS